MMMLHPVLVIYPYTPCVMYCSDPSFTHRPTPDTHQKGSLRNTQQLTTHVWPTVVQHTAAHVRYVTLSPTAGTQVFSVGTGGRGLLGQRLGAIAPQDQYLLQGGARVTWLFRVRQGTSNPSFGSLVGLLRE
jgi:hypothetical protein